MASLCSFFRKEIYFLSNRIHLVCFYKLMDTF